MGILNTLDEDKRYSIEIIVSGLNAKVEEFSKYTRKTPENIIIINKISNLTAMLTMFREPYYYQIDKIIGAVDVSLLSKVDYGEKNLAKSLDRKKAIIKSIETLCRASNAYFHRESEIKTKKECALLFYADYEKYVKKCLGQNDYKNAGKAPNIFNLAIKHIKTFFGKDSKEEKVSEIEIPRLGSDESVSINIGQLTGNKEFDNCFIKILPYKVSVYGALFGHNVNWELKNTDAKPVSFTTTLRPKTEPKPGQTPQIKPAVKAADKPVEEKKVAAAPPVATPTPPVKEPVVEPTNTAADDDDEPPSFDDFEDVDDEEQDNEQEYL
ncbi:hypothetical protein [Pseudomonas mohnii]